MPATQNSSHSRSHRWSTDLLFLALFLITFYALWLGSYALFTPDEGRYSEVAREMLASHDYITPRLDGVAFLDKPALYYWLQASAIRFLGLNEWALRCWPALLGVLGCLMTYATGRVIFNRRTGILSALVLATSPLYFGAAHYANLDLEVAAFISATLLFSLLALHSTSQKWQPWLFIAAYICMALAVLTKGLIGIVFPIAIIGSWIIILKRWDLLKKMRLLTGILIFSAITLPWYVLVQEANPQFLHFFFVTQQFSRFLSHDSFNDKTSFWFYVPIVAAGVFPWTFFLIQSITACINKIWKNRQIYSIELFLFLWIMIIFLFFSVPKSKTVGYILPIFPALALLIGNYLNTHWDKSKKITRIMTACAVVFLLTLTSILPHYNTKSIKPLAVQLKPLLKPEDEVVTYLKYYQDLPLYLERRITIVNDWQSPEIANNDNWVRELWYGMPFQDTSSWLIERKQLQKKWDGDKRIILIINKKYYTDLVKSVRRDPHLIYHKNNILVVSNLK